jgi:hypothetical protein
MTRTRKWTFMVYMAGDNGKVFDDGMRLMKNLEGYGWYDIKEMREVGSTEDVAVVVQYDTLSESDHTYRFYVKQSNVGEKSVEKIPPVNTGDPKNLTDFIVWATTDYPAEKYALILWNHGTGWKEDDIYRRYRELEKTRHRDQVRALSPTKHLLRRALFLSTAAEIMGVEDDEVRGICYDDSSLDFLDNQDLVKALSDAEAKTGQRLSVLGMDACLMSMIEVAYQVREHADYLVGSQEEEPASGWPYKEILTGLVSKPEMSALDLSQLIVQEFGDFYYSRSGRGGGGDCTQSAIDLKTVSQTFAKVSTLSESVVEAYPSDWTTERAISRIRHDVQKFRDKDYVDLRHLMQLLEGEYCGHLGIADLAHDLAEHLAPGAPRGPIVSNFSGSGRPKAYGLSIYFPSSGCSPFYERQAFALSGWNRVIRRANRLGASAHDQHKL